MKTLHLGVTGWGPPAKLRILGWDAAGRSRGPKLRPPPRAGRGVAAPRVRDLGWARPRCRVACGMLTMVEPRLKQEIEKESLLVSLVLPPPEGQV